MCQDVVHRAGARHALVELEGERVARARLLACVRADCEWVSGCVRPNLDEPRNAHGDRASTGVRGAGAWRIVFRAALRRWRRMVFVVMDCAVSGHRVPDGARGRPDAAGNHRCAQGGGRELCRGNLTQERFHAVAIVSEDGSAVTPLGWSSVVARTGP